MKKAWLFFGWAALSTLRVFGQTPMPAATPMAALEPLEEKTFTWQQPSRADGITLYWSKVPHSDIVAFRGEGVVDAPMDKVATIIADTSRGTEWIDGLVASKVIDRTSDTDFVEYDHQGVPFPFDQLISDRDFVSQVHIEADPQTHGMIISYVAAEDPAVPPLKKYVRGKINYCRFKMMPMTLPGQTYVVAEVDADPEGHLAPWLVNFFQEGWPHTTFQNLRQEAQKNDIHPFPWIDQLIDSTGPFTYNPSQASPTPGRRKAPARPS